jgi:hypothetical protein
LKSQPVSTSERLTIAFLFLSLITFSLLKAMSHREDDLFREEM